MIVLRGVYKKCGCIEVLRGVDLTVARGEVCGLLAPRGAGKSTLMKILAGFIKMDRGFGMVNGWDLSKIDHPGDLHIGYVPQELKLFPWMTGQETLEYLAAGWKTQRPRQRAEEVLSWSGLSGNGGERVRDYSPLLKMQLGLAAASLRNPELLLFDEPVQVANLARREQIIGLITDLKRAGKTILIATESMDNLQMLCDRVVQLSHGVLE